MFAFTLKNRNSVQFSVLAWWNVIRCHHRHYISPTKAQKAKTKKQPNQYTQQPPHLAKAYFTSCNEFSPHERAQSNAKKSKNVFLCECEVCAFIFRMGEKNRVDIICHELHNNFPKRTSGQISKTKIAIKCNALSDGISMDKDNHRFSLSHLSWLKIETD